MNTICINKSVLEKYNIEFSEFLYMMLLCNVDNYKDIQNIVREKLLQSGYISGIYDNNFVISSYKTTEKGNELLDSIILESEPSQEPVDKLDSLASALKDIFPKGKKPGTNYYWADGKALIIRRLKLFFKKYGNIYTDKQIIKAANKYVSSFNGDYSYMRILKYFIFKEKIGVNGDIEGDSELITYIENDGQEDEGNRDWTTTLK